MCVCVCVHAGAFVCMCVFVTEVAFRFFFFFSHSEAMVSLLASPAWLDVAFKKLHLTGTHCQFTRVNKRV